MENEGKEEYPSKQPNLQDSIKTQIISKKYWFLTLLTLTAAILTLKTYLSIKKKSKKR
jgi:hypothetical protein